MAKWQARQWADPEAHKVYKQREHERNQRQREEGGIKTVAQMTPREISTVKRLQRINLVKYKHRKKAAKSILRPSSSLGPNAETRECKYVWGAIIVIWCYGNLT